MGVWYIFYQDIMLSIATDHIDTGKLNFEKSFQIKCLHVKLGLSVKLKVHIFLLFMLVLLVFFGRY